MASNANQRYRDHWKYLIENSIRRTPVSCVRDTNEIKISDRIVQPGNDNSNKQRQQNNLDVTHTKAVGDRINYSNANVDQQ